ncbi:MAG: chaperone modulator CbpM [Betaproteobacteria bacterium]
MATEQDETAWMTDHCRVTLAELASLSGLPDEVLRELVDCGALAPLDPREGDGTFSAHYVVSMRTAGRLRSDFELDANALAVALSFIERIRELEEQLHAARAQAPRRLR